MKNFSIVFLLLLAVHANASTEQGYSCLPANHAAAIKLKSLAPKLGNAYLSEIGVLVLSPDQCGKEGAAIYSDICEVGPFTLTIEPSLNAELVVTDLEKIRLKCEQTQEARP